MNFLFASVIDAQATLQTRLCLHLVLKYILGDQVTSVQPRHVAIYTYICLVSPRCPANHFCSDFFINYIIPLVTQAMKAGVGADFWDDSSLYLVLTLNKDISTNTLVFVQILRL